MKPQKQSAVLEVRKSTYTKPGLQTYGNLAEITSTVGTNGVADNCTKDCGGHNKTRT
jgi:hypothetical protein